MGVVVCAGRVRRGPSADPRGVAVVVHGPGATEGGRTMSTGGKLSLIVGVTGRAGLHRNARRDRPVDDCRVVLTGVLRGCGAPPSGSYEGLTLRSVCLTLP